MRPVSRGVAVGMPYIWSSVAASTVACAVLEPRPLNIGSRLKTGLLTAFLSVGRRRPAEPPSCWGPLYGSGRSLRGALSGQVGPARGGCAKSSRADNASDELAVPRPVLLLFESSPRAGAPGKARTCTGPGLSRLPLPVGLRGRAAHPARRRSPERRAQDSVEAFFAGALFAGAFVAGAFFAAVFFAAAFFAGFSVAPTALAGASEAG